ncbi:MULTISPECIES: 4-hydroxy-tetrahydrodipicolinate synthase [Bradyrhizobium]|uniref:4-hydroxy-tetrahydrodipicolinate synthase n=1 Tax=Bradyrhizobium brasilense TaxID=1419277 RepID=A0ABY8JP24_9BRAD|nr:MULTISPECIES: 4-hydroxy-tetrahydrodipicolinate synthase [Bradyrhizobium]OMI15422.1 4-hydroxy-tetrahydrodipicolinate synthase [Bradyrhizobium brasilense]WFU66251.1 4-hydroxy-tetrahydrodipicolinate synthase [Bradyrhizobium brasilense]
MTWQTAAKADTAGWLSGFIPDLPTPFNHRGEIDVDAFGRLCERQIAAGATALVVGETAGESATLEPAERAQLVRIAAGVARKRVRIIAGAGSNATDRAVTFTRAAEAAGADAVMSVVPYYNKPMPRGTAAHFHAVAAATTLPVILHDIPSRTVKGLANETLLELAASPRFVGLRDGSGDVARLARLRSRLPATFRMLTGDDASSLAWLAAGGDGCISVVTNVAPDLYVAVHRHFREGRLYQARELHQRLVPLATLLEREHPAALKFALSLLGFMPPTTRLPIVQLNGSAKAEVSQAMAELADEYLAAAH